VAGAELLLKCAVGKPVKAENRDEVEFEAWRLLQAWPWLSEFLAAVGRAIDPEMAQTAMRRCKLDLTMNFYADPRQLDLTQAVNTLSALPPAVRTGGCKRARCTRDCADSVQSGSIGGNACRNKTVIDLSRAGKCDRRKCCPSIKRPAGSSCQRAS
jgi:hypothetical protein